MVSWSFRFPQKWMWGFRIGHTYACLYVGRIDVVISWH